jgi:hypothetical protein
VDRFDGLGGNQVPLLQALDALLGIEQYLSPRDMERNVPRRQRDLCYALRKHSLRRALGEMNKEDKDVVAALQNFNEILKRLGVSLSSRGCAFCNASERCSCFALRVIRDQRSIYLNLHINECL